MASTTSAEPIVALKDLFVEEAQLHIRLLSAQIPQAAWLAISSATEDERVVFRSSGSEHFKSMLNTLVKDVCGPLTDCDIIAFFNQGLRGFFMSTAVLAFVLGDNRKIEDFYRAIGASDRTSPQAWLVKMFLSMSLVLEEFGREMYKKYNLYIEQDPEYVSLTAHEKAVFGHYKQQKRRNSDACRTLGPDGKPPEDDDRAIAWSIIQSEGWHDGSGDESGDDDELFLEAYGSEGEEETNEGCYNGGNAYQHSAYPNGEKGPGAITEADEAARQRPVYIYQGVFGHRGSGAQIIHAAEVGEEGYQPEEGEVRE
ncbi:hypothetical protein R3P38DRAFT_3172748 [Favolaschia claudopus]|uniref:Uncharacterized protein n=1 Tax=Favolaschia claudopus TaxID=2862362 RepID=A0AAW0DLB9_9AGAR